MRAHCTRRLVGRARALRKNQTPAERRLWFDFLRSHRVKFRRQVPFQGYILDFYSPALRLCLELDGRSHGGEAARAYDAERTRLLEGAGIRVLRLSNDDVMRNFKGVCTVIDRTCNDGSP